MNFKKKLVFTLISLLSIFRSCLLADPAFLKIIPGSKEASMGEAGASIYGSLSAMALNPAGLAFLRRDEIVSTYLSHFKGIRYVYLAGSRRIGQRNIFACSVVYINSGNEAIRDTLGQKTGDSFAYIGSAYSLSYALRIGRILSLGISPKIATEKILNYSDNFNLLDFGLFLRLNNFNVGMSMIDKRIDDESNIDIVKYILSSTYQKEKLTFSIDTGYKIKNYFVSSGIQYRFLPRFSIMSGINIIPHRLRYSLGMEFQYNTSFRFNYAFIPYENLGTTHRFSVNYYYGKYRVAEKKHIGIKAKPADIKKGSNIAVINFVEQSPISSQEASFITELFRGALVRTGYYKVVDRNNMDMILAEQGIQQTGCTSTECAVKLGKILNVENMISGKFGKLGEYYILTINVINVETAEIVYSGEASCKRLVPEEVKRMTEQLALRFTGK